MNFLDKLERKLGKYCVKNLPLYLVVIYGIGFLSFMIDSSMYGKLLCLDMGKIFHGQVWRLVTWLAFPPSTSVLFGFFMLYLYFVIGKNIEAICGEFKYNFFIFFGLLLNVLACPISYLFYRAGITATYIILTPEQFNMSIFLAYTILIPDAMFLLFFFIPIKAKWLGYIYLGFTLYEFIQAFRFGAVNTFMEIAVSLINLAIFYFAIAKQSRVDLGNLMKQKAKEFAEAKKEQSEKINKMRPASNFHHKCAVCGKTELDDPNLSFRYCSKCNSEKEYCAEHLFTHIHVTNVVEETQKEVATENKDSEQSE